MIDPRFKTPRKRMRLDGYDYSREGAYFITICTQNREPFFFPPDVKAMIDVYWNKIAEKFSGIELDEYVIMPNHLHGIVLNVGADPCVGPKSLSRMMQWFKTFTTNAYLDGIKDNGWTPIIGKLWQRGFHERIVRNKEEHVAFRKYIRQNPSRWDEDEENPMNTYKKIYTVTKAQIKKYQELPLAARLQWLEDANRFLYMAMTEDAKKKREAFRKGEI